MIIGGGGGRKGTWGEEGVLVCEGLGWTTQSMILQSMILQLGGVGVVHPELLTYFAAVWRGK